MKQRYLPYLYDQNDPAEIADAPPPIEIAMAMGEILVPGGIPIPRDDERSRMYGSRQRPPRPCTAR